MVIGDLLNQVRTSGPPRHWPNDSTLALNNDDAQRRIAYQSGWAFCEMVASRYGEKRLVPFYVAVSPRARLGDRTPRRGGEKGPGDVGGAASTPVAGVAARSRVSARALAVVTLVVLLVALGVALAILVPWGTVGSVSDGVRPDASLDFTPQEIATGDRLARLS